MTDNVDALISGLQWPGTSLTYALPTLATQYLDYNILVDENRSFQPIPGGLASVIANVMAQYSAVSGLSISLTSNTATATMLFGRTADADTAFAYLPDTSPGKGGDVWFGLDPAFDAPISGSYGWVTTLHEIGHALGLKHAHTYIGGTGIFADNVGIINQPVAANRDAMEFTIMTYRSYVGQDLAVFDYYTNEEYGFAQSLMMLDIAAIQKIYGADFTANSGNSTYSFSTTTGEMFINGAGQGAPGANRVFRTVWDGGGTDTYDFSAYATSQSIDLAPGGWSLMSTVQRVDLGNGNFSSGNLYNAMQYQADVRSLIENAIGGSGNDTISGNTADNALTGNDGADSLTGLGGNDTLTGGAGVDTLVGGDGNDFYNVDGSDVIVEDAGGASGYDIVMSAVNFVLPDNVEQLVIQGGATQGTGGNTANYLYGGNAVISLRLDGGGGDDVIYASLSGGNTLIGGAGVDTLLIYGGDIASNNANGGIGSDIYYTYSVNDVLSEVGGDGIDTVYSSHNITLASGFEQLLLFAAATSATGSADNNIMYGNSTTGAVSLSGLDGSDVLIGGAFNDTLNGGSGVDLLFGYGGTNTLTGGDDTDIYYLETAGNIITETTTGGFDTIYSNFAGTTAMAANVEQLILYGNATGGTGTSGDDGIYANSAAGPVTLDGAGGNDYLLGSAFADTLIGGTGNDQFALSQGGIDRIRYSTAGNMGADTVFNFDAAANDLIDLTGRGYVAGNIGAAITIATFGGGTLVTFASGSLAGTTINLTGVAVGNVTGADFVF